MGGAKSLRAAPRYNLFVTEVLLAYKTNNLGIQPRGAFAVWNDFGVSDGGVQREMYDST